LPELALGVIFVFRVTAVNLQISASSWLSPLPRRYGRVEREHHGTYPVTKGWFSLSGIAGKGSLASGLLLAVFMYTGWDATVYVNEEVTHRRVHPGQSAVFAVAFLMVIFTVATAGLQGVVSPARLQANSSSALVYVAQALGGSGWAKVMALALALSVIATTGVSIVILARIMYAMASHRVLPAFLGKVSPRFKTPAAGSILTSLTLIAILWAYLLSSSIASAFTQLIDVTGILTAGFYILPDSPCHPGHDHYVGWHAGCPACGRLKAVCAGWRACSVRRSSFAPLRLAVLRLRLAWRARRRPGPSCCGTPGRCSRL